MTLLEICSKVNNFDWLLYFSENSSDSKPRAEKLDWQIQEAP